MNCNFLESEYFYHTQPRGQGESAVQGGYDKIRPLSFSMPHPSISTVEPTEQSSVIAESITSAVEPP